MVRVFGNRGPREVIVTHVTGPLDFPIVVDRTEYRIRAIGGDRYEVFREGQRLGAFFGPHHQTPHRVVPLANATVAELRELYAVVHAWRELWVPASCAG